MISIAEEYDYTLKDRSRVGRRYKDMIKALSKRNKDMRRGDVFKNHPWYDNLHQYSKNKIHCSCLMCAFNGRRNGHVVFKVNTVSDLRKIASLNRKEEEYFNEV